MNTEDPHDKGKKYETKTSPASTIGHESFKDFEALIPSPNQAMPLPSSHQSSTL